MVLTKEYRICMPLSCEEVCFFYLFLSHQHVHPILNNVIQAFYHESVKVQMHFFVLNVFFNKSFV